MGGGTMTTTMVGSGYQGMIGLPLGLNGDMEGTILAGRHSDRTRSSVLILGFSTVRTGSLRMDGGHSPTVGIWEARRFTSISTAPQRMRGSSDGHDLAEASARTAGASSVGVRIVSTWNGEETCASRGPRSSR